MAAVTICSDFGAPQNKVWHCFYCFPIYFPWSDGTRCHDIRFLNVELQANFSLSSFTFIKRLFSSSSLSAIRVIRWSLKGFPVLTFCHFQKHPDYWQIWLTQEINKIFAKGMCKECKVLMFSTDLRTLQTKLSFKCITLNVSFKYTIYLQAKRHGELEQGGGHLISREVPHKIQRRQSQWPWKWAKKNLSIQLLNYSPWNSSSAELVLQY